MPDMLIRGADVIDGTGSPAYRADVVVAGGSVADLITDRGRPPGFAGGSSGARSAHCASVRSES